MGMKAEACCNSCSSPLGAAEWSPQDFTLFLINYSHDLSANVREGAALDNTWKDKNTLLKPSVFFSVCGLLFFLKITWLNTYLWRICCILVLSSVHFQIAPWNVFETLCLADKSDLSVPCEGRKKKKVIQITVTLKCFRTHLKEKKKKEIRKGANTYSWKSVQNHLFYSSIVSN